MTRERGWPDREEIREAFGVIRQYLNEREDGEPTDAALSALAAAEAGWVRAQGVIDNAISGIYVATLGGRIKDCNPSMARMLGYPDREGLLAVTDFGKRHYIDPEERRNLLDRLLSEKGFSNIRYTLKRLDGRPVYVVGSMRLLKDKGGPETLFQGVVVDVTARRMAEEKLKKSEAMYRRIIRTAAEGFLRMDEDMVIREANDAYLRMTGYEMSDLVGLRPFDLMEPEWKDYIRANRASILSQETRRHEGCIRGKDGRTIPILAHGSTLRDDDGNLIGHIAFCTDMTEHKKALALAGEVQRTLLRVTAPTVPGLDTAGRSVPCESVGGDYFDFFVPGKPPHRRLIAVVGDVSGHGIDAALLMTTARAYLQVTAGRPGGIAAVADGLNRRLCRDVGDSGRFMSMFFMDLDPEARSLRWIRAGHPPALLINPEIGAVSTLMAGGPVMGIDRTWRREVGESVELPEKAIAVMATDGLYEARNLSGEMFGEDRVAGLVLQNAEEPATKIVDAVFGELFAFTRGVRQEDDWTLVVARFSPETGCSA